LIAAKQDGGGGLSTTGWIVITVVVIALVIVVSVYRARSEPDVEALRIAYLKERLEPLSEAACRGMCYWLAKSTLEHQQALEAALNAREGIDQVQGDEQDV
jgi:hypothetical protein